MESQRLGNKMKVWRLLSVLVIVLYVPCGYAIQGLTVGQYLEWTRAGEASQEQVKTYVGGIGQGIFFASTFGFQTLKNQPLFCPPSSVTITGELQIEILNNFIKKSKFNLDKFPVGIVMADALSKEFPCK